jgi:hypothetical protein
MRLSWVTGVAATGCLVTVLWAGGCANGLLATTSDAGGGVDAGGDTTTGTCPQYDLQTDPHHCGSCANVCQSTEVCSSGQCKASCEPPTTKCLNTDAGLCIDLSNTVDHCGQCTTSCGTGDAGGPQSGTEDNPDAGIPAPDGGFPPPPYWSIGSPTCDGGACGVVCPPPMLQCSDMICYDTENAHDHCGGCSNACATDTQWCTHGNCCPVGQAYCGSACTDILSDASNCGSCGHVCSGTAPLCGGGVCTSGITYTDAFTTNVTATTQCTDWKSFLAKLTGTYVSALSCGGYTWEVYLSCGSSTPELSADGTTCACPTTGYDVRPCITTDANWGGVNTATCGAPSQTMTVTCQ